MGTAFFRRRQTWVFVVLLSLPVTAVLLFIVYGSYWNQIVSRGAPVNEQVETFNETDFLVVVTRPNMDIPVHNVFIPKDAWFFVDIYPNKNIKVESVMLSGNSSSSLNFNSRLNQLSAPGESNTNTQNTQPVSQTQDSGSAIYYGTSVQAYHPLEIRKSNQTHVLTILYRNLDDQTNKFSLPLVMKENFLWRIETWDLGNFNYFWIIFAGVVLSRIFPLFSNQAAKQQDGAASNQSGSSSSTTTRISERIKLTLIELVWVPFSAIITLLIFSSFKGQVQPTSDIIGNVALAFGFGFGFDKVLNMGHRV
jgi:hypothetical protein